MSQLIGNPAELFEYNGNGIVRSIDHSALAYKSEHPVTYVQLRGV